MLPVPEHPHNLRSSLPIHTFMSDNSTESPLNCVISRVTEHNGATYGILTINNKPIGVTLELKWNGNKKRTSCIPTGQYKMVRHISPKFGECFMVENVEGRSHILFHVGNCTADTVGCILVGSGFVLGGIGKSRDAFAVFMRELANWDTANLEIRDVGKLG